MTDAQKAKKAAVKSANVARDNARKRRADAFYEVFPGPDYRGCEFVRK